jgi:hypothetical protein
MLRAAVLHPVLRGIRRFSTSSHPEALGACYVASWQLPRPDLHRSADDDFSGHTMRLLGGTAIEFISLVLRAISPGTNTHRPAG